MWEEVVGDLLPVLLDTQVCLLVLGSLGSVHLCCMGHWLLMLGDHDHSSLEDSCYIQVLHSQVVDLLVLLVHLGLLKVVLSIPLVLLLDEDSLEDILGLVEEVLNLKQS